MEKIEIVPVSNGYLVTVEGQSVQSFYGNTKSYVAKTSGEVIGIIMRELS